MQCLLKTVVSQILVVLIPHAQVLYLLEDCWDQSPRVLQGDEEKYSVSGCQVYNTPRCVLSSSTLLSL